MAVSEHPNDIQNKIKQSLRFSIFDGAFASSMIGFGESYFVAFAVLLKASNLQLGMLSTLPQAIGSVFQLGSYRLIGVFGSRKRLVCVSVLVQALIFAPIALSFFAKGAAVYQLMVFVGLYWILGMILGPAWNSWMGDLTDERQRGAYFGKRSKIIALSSFSSFVLAGVVLDYFNTSTLGQQNGFVVIFGMACLARMVSFYFLTRKYEPEYHATEETAFGLHEFLTQERFSGFRAFALYFGLMNFSVYLAAPFFVPYMLKDLGFSYISFTLVQAAAVGVKFIAIPIWGRVSDQFGARKIIAITGFMMPIIPILWAFSPDVRYLFMIEMYSGLIWGGFEISTFKFAFDTTTARNRARCMSYFAMINGLCIFAGAVVGALVVWYNHVFWSQYLLVFIISGLVRYIVSFSFVRKLKEVMTVEDIPYSKLFFKVISMMPTMGFIYGIIPFKRTKRG